MKLIKLMKAKLSIDIIIKLMKLIKLNIVKNDCKTNCKWKVLYFLKIEAVRIDIIIQKRSRSLSEEYYFRSNKKPLVSKKECDV